jgi:hypothetical protein
VGEFPVSLLLKCFPSVFTLFVYIDLNILKVKDKDVTILMEYWHNIDFGIANKHDIFTKIDPCEG